MVSEVFVERPHAREIEELQAELYKTDLAIRRAKPGSPHKRDLVRHFEKVSAKVNRLISNRK